MTVSYRSAVTVTVWSRQIASPLLIKERLGHSSITVTMDRYGGLFPRLEEAIGEGLEGVLRDSLAAWVRPETASTVHLRT